ncbi:MAG: PAS domain S-box protein [Desulfohalobiaceae bacterium]|nr:PAS domain S-box protein [Desulfohalobiaceae bacterium]
MSQKNSPAWIAIAGGAVICGLVLALAWMSVSREQAVTSRILAEKGTALIRSFEAGTRTGLRGGLGSRTRLQTLIEETAAQSDISFIAVTDSRGRILSHSKKSRSGQRFLSQEMLKELDPGPETKRRLLNLPEYGEVFVVYSTFSPYGGNVSGGKGPARGWGQRRGRGGMPGCPRPERDPPAGATDPQRCARFFGDPDFWSKEHFIFLGLDSTPYFRAKQQDIRRTLIISGALLVVGLACLLALFWAHRVKVTRRLLRNEEAVSSVVVSSLPLGVLILDAEDSVVLVNRAAGGILGLEDSGTGPQAEGDLPAPLRDVLKALETEDMIPERETILERDGASLPVSLSGSSASTRDGVRVGKVLLMRDLSRIKDLQARLREQEKLAAIGHLASGVAHEIRNPLSSIKGYAVYFRSRFPEGSSEEQAAQTLIREVDRLNHVVTELLEFSRPASIQPRPTQLGDLIRRSLELIEQDLVKKDIQTRLHPGPEDLRVSLDPDRFGQVFLNLFLNAVQAMSPKGVLEVEVLAEGEHEARIEVRDSGPGIPEENLNTVFNPYFTSKGSGTGLGLAIARKIVEAHGGAIHAENRPEGGAVFILSLPLKEQGASHDGATTHRG